MSLRVQVEGRLWWVKLLSQGQVQMVVQLEFHPDFWTEGNAALSETGVLSEACTQALKMVGSAEAFVFNADRCSCVNTLACVEPSGFSDLM